MKRIAWIDTIRVAAAFMIIFAHYFMCDDFAESLPYFKHALSYDVAIIGVALFLAISGYLIPASLKRAPDLWHFYLSKFIRIVVPFTVSWFVMLAILILPALFNDDLASRLPTNALLRGGNFSAMILGMFPVDLNVTKLLGFEIYWFVGEWFMGAILWLYLLSPLLNYCAERRPLFSLIISIGVSFAAYYVSQGIVYDAWTLFIVRVPEFLFGIILFIYRDKLKQFHLPLFLLSGIVLATYAIYFAITLPPQGALFFVSNPKYFLLTLPMIYLLFTLTEVFNALLPKIFARFNSLNAASYIAMIIQHVVIYAFADILGFEKLGTFGIFLVLLIVMAITFETAQLIKKLSDPVEKIFSK